MTSTKQEAYKSNYFGRCFKHFNPVNSSMELIPYQESDLPEYVRLRNLADPSRPVTLEHIQHHDATRAKDLATVYLRKAVAL